MMALVLGLGTAAGGLGFGIFGAFGVGLAGLCAGLCVAAGGLLLMRWNLPAAPASASRDASVFFAVAMAFLAIVVFALCHWFNWLRGYIASLLPSVVSLLAVMGGLLAVARTRRFAWKTNVIVGIALASALFMLVYPPIAANRARAMQAERTGRFKPTISQCNELVNSAPFESAFGPYIAAIMSEEGTQLPTRFGPPAEIDGSVVVLTVRWPYRGWGSVLGTSPCEGYMPRGLLAAEPSDVRFVAFVASFAVDILEEAKGVPAFARGRYGARIRTALRFRTLVYRWPQRTLWLSADVDTECTPSDTASVVNWSAAKALSELLSEASQ